MNSEARGVQAWERAQCQFQPLARSKIECFSYTRAHRLHGYLEHKNNCSVRLKHSQTNYFSFFDTTHTSKTKPNHPSFQAAISTRRKAEPSAPNTRRRPQASSPRHTYRHCKTPPNQQRTAPPNVSKYIHSLQNNVPSPSTPTTWQFHMAHITRLNSPCSPPHTFSPNSEAVENASSCPMRTCIRTTRPSKTRTCCALRYFFFFARNADCGKTFRLSHLTFEHGPVHVSHHHPMMICMRLGHGAVSSSSLYRVLICQRRSHQQQAFFLEHSC